MSPSQALSLESYRPTPGRLWIRHRPRHWPGADGLWTDWAHRSLGRPGRSEAALPDDSGRLLDDVVYLPPVSIELAAAREELAERWQEAGVPLLVQRLAGEADVPDSDSSVWDLLPALLYDGLETLSELPPATAVVWPLVAGLTDGTQMVEDGLARLAGAGVATAQPMVLELSSSARRQLARGTDESTFDRLFHGAPPSARAFSARAVAHGVSPFLPRPLPAGPRRLKIRRKCAGELRQAAELYHLLGRPEIEGQRLLRSARWIDREDYDLAGLAAENNLAIVEWFDSTSRRLIEEVIRHGGSTLVEALEKDYTGPARGVESG